MTDWDSIYIYYISGTGNARISSEWIAGEAAGYGLKTVVQKIDRAGNIILPAEKENPLIGFAFPTHGFNAAPLMLRFIAGFPAGPGKKVFLLNTRAGMKLSKLFTPGISGVALIIPALILLMKGYRCIGFRPVDLPSNWISLHPGLKKKVISSIFERCEKIVRAFTGKILSGKKVYRGLYSLPLDLLLSPVAFGYYIAGRFFLAKTFYANNNCTKCEICIKECPTASLIMVNKRPYWKISCESCMRCFNICPEKAVETAHGPAVGFYFLIMLINTWTCITVLNIFNINSGTFWWKTFTQVLGLVLTIIIPAVSYVVLHYAIGFKPVNSFVRYTSLTALPFWRRYKPDIKYRKRENRSGLKVTVEKN